MPDEHIVTFRYPRQPSGEPCTRLCHVFLSNDPGAPRTYSWFQMKAKVENICALGLSIAGSLLVVAMAFGVLSATLSLASGIACFTGAIALLNNAG